MSFRKIATNAKEYPSDAKRCNRCEALKALCLRLNQITALKRPALHSKLGQILTTLDQGIL